MEDRIWRQDMEIAFLLFGHLAFIIKRLLHWIKMEDV